MAFTGRFVVIVGAWFCAMAGWPAAAQTLFTARSGDTNAGTLTVYSSLDLTVARPLVDAFQDENPQIAVNYHELQTLDIYERLLTESDDEGTTADIAISSAMDLQMKLANDGYARAVPLANSALWPEWAIWRNAAIALTYEPAVMVYHKPSFAGGEVPRTRAALMTLLENEPDRMFGRVATYDIEGAGVGFLFLARDAEHNRGLWDLVAAMGGSGVKLYSNSSAILERVADGRFAIGYNILGSYASVWAEKNPDLGVILPSDYTVVMSRIALVPEAALNPQLGTRFLDFLMSQRGQEVMANQAKLGALHPRVGGPNTAKALRKQAGAQLRPISVSPGLLVYLDQVKRARFIERWNQALRQK